MRVASATRPGMVVGWCGVGGGREGRLGEGEGARAGEDWRGGCYIAIRYRKGVERRQRVVYMRPDTDARPLCAILETIHPSAMT